MKNNIKEYLSQKGISYRESGKELIAKCIFSNCDSNSRENEGHLYFDIDTSQYQCKKCDAKGNIITLQKHFVDVIEKEKKKNIKSITPTMVEKIHEALPIEIIEYLHARGISDEIIKSQKLGYMNQYGKS